MDNNWLATQQIVAFKKEYNAADGLIAKAQVTGKWAYISSKQDVLTQFGIGKGLAQSGWSDVTGLAEFIAHPIDGLKGLKALVSDPKAREQFGDAFVTELNAKIDDITKAVETGGDDNAVVLGQRIGEIAWQVGSVVTGVGGAAKGGVALAKAGIKVGAQQLEKMAEVAKIEKLAKLEQVAKAEAPATSSAVNNLGEGQAFAGKAANSADRLNELRVEGFNPYDNPRYKELPPDKQKAFLQEYNKQLQAQQDAINSMTADEFKIARDAYLESGRNPAADSLQRSLGREFEGQVAESIRRSLINKGTAPSEATTIAKARAKEIRSGLAALHEPDMVAGGWTTPAPIRMGDSNVNSSIGASWSNRLPAIDQAVNAAIASGEGSAKLNVRLELLRGAK